MHKEIVKKAVYVDVYNTSGKVVGKESLPKDMFAATINPVLVAQAVRVYQANTRRGTHSTKTRSEVVGSTRKIYRQKGTGRARHGSIKAPIFIGGGVAHGPHPRDYRLKLPQKMRRIALASVLSAKLKDGSIKIIDKLSAIPAKTKSMIETLANLTLFDKKEKQHKSILLITNGQVENIKLAGRNIPYLSIVPVQTLNTYEAFAHDALLFMRDALSFIREPKQQQHVQTQQITLVKAATKRPAPKPAPRTRKTQTKKRSKTSR